MSAICGLIYRKKNNKIEEEIINQMMSEFNVRKALYSKVWQDEQCFLGCFHQVITPEAQDEILPFHDNTDELVITSDAVIDNREELFAIIGIEKERWSSISDSQLIVLAYKKWGENCTKHLIGDYAFVIYDKNQDKLFCVRDHIGKRTFYYYADEEIFAFSTLMKPLLTISKPRNKLNDQWIANYLTYEGVMHEIDPETTIYSEIKQLLPAHSMTINNHQSNIIKYWTPFKKKNISYKTDKEYEEELLRLLRQATKCRLRSKGNVGLLLSGGIDSGTIGLLAGELLQAENKQLYAYSNIPIEKLVPDCIKKDKYTIYDESKYIKLVIDKIPNIKHKFHESKDKHSLSNIEEHLAIIEHPYKTIENQFWVKELTQLAANDQCTILLDGQFGNMTFSYGEMPIHLVTLFKKFRLYKLYREIEAYSQLFDISKKLLVKELIKMVVPREIRNLYHKLSGIKEKSYKSFANKSFIEECHTYKRFKQLKIGPYQKSCVDIEQVRRIVMKPTGFNQIGGMNTKMSLAFGVQFRDPAMDIRVIEFCLNTPYGQFVRDGKDRNLIRRTMKDIVPDEILFNYTSRGLQGADWFDRLKPLWLDIKKELEYMITQDEIKFYLDCNEIENELIIIGEKLRNKHKYHFRSLVICLILGKYLKN